MALFSIIHVYDDAELRVSFKCNHHYSYTIKSTKNANSECSRSRLEGDANDWPRPRPCILYEKICEQCFQKEWERRQRIINTPHTQRIDRIPHMNPPPVIFGRTNSPSSLPSSSSSLSLLTPLSLTGLGQRLQKQIEKFASCQQEIFIYKEVHKLGRFLPHVQPSGACLDIIRAADRLRETNENIREWEIEHGISLSDLYYRRHTGSADLLAQCGREVVTFILRTCVCVDFGFPGSINLLENARSMIPEVGVRLSVLEERIGFKTAHLQTVKDTKLLDRAQDFIAAIATESIPEAATNHPSIAEPDGSVHSHWPPPPTTIWLTELQELQELLPQSMRYADDILAYALNSMTYLKLELDNHRTEILHPEELSWQFPSIASTLYLTKSHQITSICDGDDSKERTSSIALDCSKDSEDSAGIWTCLRGDNSKGKDAEQEDAEGPAVVQLPAKSEPFDCKGGAVIFPEHAIPGMEEENRNEAIGNSPVVDSEAKDSEGENAEGEDSDGKDSDGTDPEKRTSSIISDQDSEDSANSSVQSIEADIGDASHSDKYHHSSQSSVITKRDELCESNSFDAAAHTSAKELGKLDFTTDMCVNMMMEEEEEELRERQSEERQSEERESEERQSEERESEERQSEERHSEERQSEERQSEERQSEERQSEERQSEERESEERESDERFSDEEDDGEREDDYSGSDSESIRSEERESEERHSEEEDDGEREDDSASSYSAYSSETEEDSGSDVESIRWRPTRRERRRLRRALRFRMGALDRQTRPLTPNWRPPPRPHPLSNYVQGTSSLDDLLAGIGFGIVELNEEEIASMESMFFEGPHYGYSRDH